MARESQTRSSHPRLARALLTLGTAEFFGPILRDRDATHLLNPSWPGHARFHLMWLMCFMALSGVVNLALIWRGPPRRARLRIAWAWQACNVLAFWGASALAGSYDGLVVDSSFHLTVLGLNENVLAFVIFSALLAASSLAIARVEDSPGE